ncbi:MAG: zinc finger domain [Parachlamydiales bacterium]|nr:zinc finger domain [Parachlamydiales bacterium]
MTIDMHSLVSRPLSDQQCSICHQVLNTENDPMVGHAALVHEGVVKVWHDYHQNCILKWLEIQHTCPYCRQSINRLNGSVLNQPVPEILEEGFDNVFIFMHLENQLLTDERRAPRYDHETVQVYIRAFLEGFAPAPFLRRQI